MKILIFGASGSGSTTLGKALAERLNYRHLNSDDYYWEQTTPPFQIKIPLEERNSAIANDFESSENVIISGSMLNWGDKWKIMFDLAVFLHLPQTTRMSRLRKREIERYGDLLKNDDKYAANSKSFLEWAEKYDDITFNGQNISRQENALKSLKCPTLKIKGDITSKERINRVLNKLNQVI